jgi:hypothetical protein
MDKLVVYPTSDDEEVKGIAGCVLGHTRIVSFNLPFL